MVCNKTSKPFNLLMSTALLHCSGENSATLTVFVYKVVEQSNSFLPFLLLLLFLLLLFSISQLKTHLYVYDVMLLWYRHNMSPLLCFNYFRIHKLHVHIHVHLQLHVVWNSYMYVHKFSIGINPRQKGFTPFFTSVKKLMCLLSSVRETSFFLLFLSCSRTSSPSSPSLSRACFLILPSLASCSCIDTYTHTHTRTFS